MKLNMNKFYKLFSEVYLGRKMKLDVNKLQDFFLKKKQQKINSIYISVFNSFTDNY